MKLCVVAFLCLVACAMSLAAEQSPLIRALSPAQDTSVQAPRQKRHLLLGAAGAGLLGAGLAAGAVGLGAGVIGAKAGLVGGALAASALHGYGRSYGGYGGYGGYGYGHGYGYGYPYGGYGGYRSYYPIHTTYVVEEPWC